MKTVRAIYHLFRADYLERVRSSAFLIILGIAIFASYFYSPPQGANYKTLSLGIDGSAIWYRGVYNSAWLGTQVALWITVWLLFAGFFLVRNTVERDISTGVGEIIATTPLSRVAYTTGKMLSNIVTLLTMLVVIIVSTAIMQFIRGESSSLDVWALVSPFLFMAVPTIIFVSALAVFFECIIWLRGTIGNVVYVVLCITLLAGTQASLDQSVSAVFDLTGETLPLHQLVTVVHTAYPSFIGTYNVGIASIATMPHTFVWAGAIWSGIDILWRVVWVALACLVSVVAAFFFSRFDPAIEQRRRLKKQVLQKQTDQADEEKHVLKEPVYLTPLTYRRKGLATLGGTLLGELRLLAKEVPRWWYMGALLWIGLCLFYPSYDVAHGVFWPIAWLWPLPIWSSLGNRERQHRTYQLIFSTERTLNRQFPMLYLAGVCITLFAASGMLIRLLMMGDLVALVVLLLGALFIPAFALCAGVWTSGRRMFEAMYLALWYAGPISHGFAVDFMGVTQQALTMRIPYIFGLLTLVLLMLAFLKRSMQMHT